MNKTPKANYYPILLLITVVLVFLEAFKVIDIGWIWVFALLWIPAAVFIAVAIIAMMIIGIAAFLYAIID